MRNRIDNYMAYLVDGDGNRINFQRFPSKMFKEAVAMMEALMRFERFWICNPGCKTIEYYRNGKLIYTQNVSRK